ncbi:dihydrofolate reductase family protein [Natronohydrobacter thiooxidans]|uniref:dihydrofolate reductase family protein n=1 Tax=Natronohydrobacter thiooxidans TaxID=87172 RepID=UPI0008FF0DAE|nr:dihydrofolate reductase family protein [Natronohydrobacter thiooxidans]
MPRLTSFTFQSLDGFFTGPGGDLSWTRHGPEELAFSQAQLARGETLVFGRRTYEHMAGFWPRPEAAQSHPAIAAGMNRAQKIVVSNGLEHTDWGPARILSGDLAAEFRALKAGDGPDMTILGSATLIRTLAPLGLLDAIEIMLYPVAIGRGTTLFDGIAQPLDLTLTDCQCFSSGSLLLIYSRATPTR